LGTVLMPVLMALTVYGAVAWTKPMPVTASRLRRPRNQKVAVALAGVATNVALAVILGLLWKFSVPFTEKVGLAPSPLWAQFVFTAGYVNALLAVFYLIPIPPLDGAAVVDRFLPPHAVVSYHRIEPYTYFIPLVLFLLDENAFLSFFSWIGNHWAQVLHLFS
ncbi:MAG: site-2 protease family protein, partial [Acidimicrobiales bacterium]